MRVSVEPNTVVLTVLAFMTAFNGWMSSRRSKKVETKVEETKAEVKVVKVLVDGSLGTEYQISATSARALAEITKRPAYMELADQAEKRLKDHLAKIGEEHGKLSNDKPVGD